MSCTSMAGSLTAPLPQFLQDLCFKEHRWLDWIASHDKKKPVRVGALASNIHESAVRIDGIFEKLCKELQRRLHPHVDVLSWFCFSQLHDFEDEVFETADIIAFALFNNAAIAKVCQAIDAAFFKDPIMMNWLSQARSSCVFSFMGGVQLTFLKCSCPKYTNSVPTQECPICFVPMESALIMTCGHLVCMDCAILLATSSTKRVLAHTSSLHYLMQNASDSTVCPMCRYPRPFTRAVTWPDPNTAKKVPDLAPCIPGST